VNNLRFPGQYYDAETGLSYNLNRSYDPTVGRYLEPDPLGLAAGTNLYSYVNANPLNYVDPLGLASIKIGGKKITVHNADVDPWPSNPHGHIYDENQLLDIHGNIYDRTTGKIISRLPKKELAKWLDFLDSIGKLGAVGDFFFFKDWVDHTCAVADPGNPYCDPRPRACLGGT
ncbi:MAG: RHS repeat-associated core domain-containing protein, partial [Betaproteobacteria bacterium]|nr:RHS repeat-associated core domain-containing protein [Betaproteobacteria bacterium]